MSGLLERMAKRALGRLPAVQPLIRSIYAAEPINAGKPSASEFMRSNEQPEIAGKPAAPARARAQIKGSQDAAPQPSRVAVTPRSNEAAAQLEQRAEPAMPQAVPQPPQRPGREVPPPSAISLASQPETPETPANPEPLLQLALTSPAIPISQDDATPIAEEVTPVAGATPQPARIQTAAEPLQPHRRRVPGAEAAAPAEQKAEINISIGSIELRAATEPRPAPAPFRPRISLQDFLKRDPGARR